ncbi:carboxypeptidase A4-like isoform X2 [Antechinus flavipes]|uniref:carboxypeptidase A4-like isoform X2 n=1 Tax=Antechinus flavipes TaxID=38775 RepID=UPI0022367552|nr:carboxypeptidase A4-like isoform X2 [Antechinus flavipes]
MRWILLFGALIGSIYGKKTYNGHQIFQIKVRDVNQIDKLKELSNMQNLQLTFWNLPVTREHPVNVVVPPASLKVVKSFLESHGLAYSVSIKDLQLYREMANIASEYPQIVKRLKIGESFEKRPLYVLKFSTGKKKRPAIWLNHGIHSREWVTQATGIWIARKIPSDFYGNKPTITSILNEMDIFLMPVANPDGYVYSQTKDRSWRKNRSRKLFKKCVGVDLNRNWNVAFAKEGASDDPCSEEYHGPKPHSEVEVKSVAKFIRKHRNFKSFIDFHSFSQLLMYPYGYTSNKCPDCDELDKLGKEAVKALYSLFGTQYQVGSIFKHVYLVSGSTIDWAYKNGIKYAFTFELRDNGTYRFDLPANQIIPTAQETWLALEVIMVYVKDHLY